MLTNIIGEGTVSTVWRAHARHTDLQVAVKVLKPQWRERMSALQRFRDEARFLTMISSPFVVSVIDICGVDSDAPHIVMELLRGVTLEQLLRQRRRLSLSQAARLVMDACEGTAAAHAAGVLHRDLKPTNLFVETQRTGIRRCKILDFGVAHQWRDTSGPARRTLVGTARYMAPEQARGERTDPRSDVYSLGAVLFECVFGAPLVAGGDRSEVLFNAIRARMGRSFHVADVPRTFQEVVERALCPEPSDRFRDTLELRAALRPWCEDSIPALHGAPLWGPALSKRDWRCDPTIND